MIAAIYARVSTDAQAEHGYSLKTQVEACRKAATEMGADTVQEYVDDGYSGAYMERPALDTMRDGIRAKAFDVIIVYTIDRLARNLAHQLIITDEIKRAGAELKFVTGEYRDTPEGRMLYQMQGAFAEYEREKIRERMMRGMRAKLKTGKPIRDSRVFGYDWRDGAYVVNEAEADVIRLIYRLYTVDRAGGISTIAMRLKELGIPSPQGAPSWSSGNVRRVLIQQMYTGRYYSSRFTSRKISATKKEHFVRPRSEWIEMLCPPIISQQTYDNAQDMLIKNRRCRKYKTLDGCILQGILRCGQCGRPVRIKRNARKNKAGVNQSYYLCSGTDPALSIRTGSRCKARSAICDLADAAFWDMLRDICRTPKSIKQYISSTGQIPASTTQETRLRARLPKIQADKSAVLEWALHGYISHDDATAKLEALKKEEDELLARLQAIEKKTGQAPPRLALKEICAAVQNCPDDAAARRSVILSILRSVTIDRIDTRPHASKYDIEFSVEFR